MLRKSVIIVCLLGTVYIAFGQSKKKKQEKEETKTEAVATPPADTVDYKAVGSPMPPVRLVQDNGDVVTGSAVMHKNILVMMFNPTCEHCQEEARIIIKNLPLFDSTKLMFLAAAGMKEYLSFFDAVTRASKHPKIAMGVDSAKFIDKTFKYQSLPQINIYNKDRKLVRIFNGEVPLDSLKPYIE